MAGRAVERNIRRRLMEPLAALTVVVVLVGLAVPQHASHRSRARELACRSALGEVRAAIAAFHAQRELQGQPRFPTLAELCLTGDVLAGEMPPNPYNGDDAVRESEWRPEAPPVFGEAGWNYDPSSGRFWADTNTAGERDF
jgi:hypothetical protein